MGLAEAPPLEEDCCEDVLDLWSEVMNAEDCELHRPLIDRAEAGGIYYPWTCECKRVPYRVSDNEDCEVSGRILDVLRDARQIYANGVGPEGWWDGAVDYVLTGRNGDDKVVRPLDKGSDGLVE